MKRIGGQLDYRVLVQQHRPLDRGLLGAEARRLLSTGFKPQDVARALRMPMPEVLELQRWLDAEPGRADESASDAGPFGRE